MTRGHFTFIATTGSFKLQRLGQIMEPAGNPMEVEGVLNPTQQKFMLPDLKAVKIQILL